MSEAHDAERELLEGGALTGLPGVGQPLPEDPDADAGQAWAARHVLRSAGLVPPWADLRTEIAEARGRLVVRMRTHLRWLARREEHLRRSPAERIADELAATKVADARVRAEMREAIAEVNALIARHNLMVTAAALHLVPLTPAQVDEFARAGL